MAYFARATMFGPERVLPFLGRDFKPITPVEIEREVREYGAFADSFSRDQVLKRPVTYAIAPADMRFNFSRIDVWYERDIGERVGDYNLYRLKLRN
jgi:hypothetical protein